MKISQRILWLVVGAVIVAAPGIGLSARADTNDLPHFQEVLRLLRANLAGVTDEELNRAAVSGLLSHFYPQVMLVTNQVPAGESSVRVSRTAIYDKAYGYIRVTEIGNGLAELIDTAYRGLVQTNKLKGLVLDLRFASGSDYEAAAKVADRFVSKEQLLLDWQEGSARSAAKPDAIKLPMVVLVNHQTTGAAEALAAVMRETDVAVLIGAPTAGGAHVFKEFILSDGRKLRIGSGPVQTGDGRKLTAEGVGPDIAVAVVAEDEALFFADPFTPLPGSATRSRSAGLTQTSSAARQTRRRVNEAELVRLQKEGLDADEPLATAPRPAADENLESVVRDPALARALDLLKGISVLGKTRQP